MGASTEGPEPWWRMTVVIRTQRLQTLASMQSLALEFNR